jgi:hypothetical protein
MPGEESWAYDFAESWDFSKEERAFYAGMLRRAIAKHQLAAECNISKASLKTPLRMFITKVRAWIAGALLFLSCAPAGTDSCRVRERALFARPSESTRGGRAAAAGGARHRRSQIPRAVRNCACNCIFRQEQSTEAVQHNNCSGLQQQHLQVHVCSCCVVCCLFAERRLRNPRIPRAAAGRPKPAARGLCAQKFALCGTSYAIRCLFKERAIWRMA